MITLAAGPSGFSGIPEPDSRQKAREKAKATMSDARAQLEAVIWRERGGDPRRPHQDVDRILDAADAYADAAREAGYRDGVARVGRAQSRDPGQPPRVVPGDIVRELEAGRPA